MKFRSGPSCPYCSSSDIWQPHVRTWTDGLLERFGFEKFECRKCRKRLLLKKARPGTARYKREQAAEVIDP